MIKRRFYKLEHSNRDGSDPSSSSDSEIEAEVSEEESEDDAITEVKQEDEAGSISSGYETDDGSANAVDVNATGLLFSEDDAGTINKRQTLDKKELSSESDPEESERESSVLVEKEPLPLDTPTPHVLKCKSVFKCRICPRIICLSEDTLRDHLQSKRHARSEKLLNEGRLKAMLNSDGELEEQEVSEIRTNDSEDDEKKIHKEKKQHKKRMRKKRNERGGKRKKNRSARQDKAKNEK
ncbi:hypothetical protein Lal_00036940 [Lupinus albus]|uniref:Putative transcription factor C2H2 family n=1 Tax=Lupinus albus TaxID=3870 RepID=A0A6A5NTI6_LUPAL|nr:putative transcription factor C2H2 family [Lupinus albus]KAF1888898.1 hypothetical protein Lal_00036940 [Lupinus albus]